MSLLDAGHGGRDDYAAVHRAAATAVRAIVTANDSSHNITILESILRLRQVPPTTARHPPPASRPPHTWRPVRLAHPSLAHLIPRRAALRRARAGAA